jgi:hypothetical protein
MTVDGFQTPKLSSPAMKNTLAGCGRITRRQAQQRRPPSAGGAHRATAQTRIVAGGQEMMSRCTVCSHPEAAAINEALARGTILRKLANRYGLSKSSAHRHVTNCLLELQADLDTDAGGEFATELPSLADAEVNELLKSLADSLDQTAIESIIGRLDEIQP